MKNSIILFLVLTLNLVRACDVMPDYVFPTIEDQSEKASYVLKGKVIQATSQNFESDDYETGFIELEVEEYFKGCGPEIIQVKGYTDSA